MNAACAQPTTHSLQEAMALSVQEPKPTRCLLLATRSSWHLGCQGPPHPLCACAGIKGTSDAAVFKPNFYFDTI